VGGQGRLLIVELQVRMQTLIGRIPWRLLLAVLGGVLVIKGASQMLIVDLSAPSESFVSMLKHGMAMVVVGGVTLIGVIVSR
jgi:hypothetical protein